MNTNGVLTTYEELERAGTFEHRTLKEEGTRRLRLKCRGWYKKTYSMGLVCYFEDPKQPDEKWQLFCFRHKVGGREIYNPKGSSVDFSKVPDGTIWDVTVETQKGNYVWTNAKEVA